MSLSAERETIGAFDRANLVALGERHWAREDSEFRLRLIRDPAFAASATDIVVEFANPLYQDLLDAFISGAEVASADLYKVWRDTTQPGAWDSPVYEEFLRAVREVNAGLPSGRRLRVVAGDAPIDWSAPGMRFEDIEHRDRFAVSAIEREVLHKERRALLVFGAGHLYRRRAGGVVELLRGNPKARCFIVIPVGLEQGSSTNPAWIRLAESAVGEAEANELFEKGTKKVKFVEGKPVLVPAQVFEPG